MAYLACVASPPCGASRPGHEPSRHEPKAANSRASARTRDMPTPKQAVNFRGYPCVVARAIALDIVAVPTLRNVHNGREFKKAPPTKIYYLIWQLPEPSTLPGLPSRLVWFLSVFISHTNLPKPGMYPRFFYDSIACPILTSIQAC